MIRTTVAFLAISSSLLFAGEKVTLKSGKTFEVETKSGMPQAVEVPQLRIKGVGPLFGPNKNTGKTEGQWLITATLKAKGDFKLIITSPIDESIRKEITITGPSEVYQQVLSESEAPAAWAWVKEPGDSWIPFVLNFQAVEAKDSFEVIQWSKFNPEAKARLNQILEILAKLKK